MSRLFQRFGNRKIVNPNGSATQEFDRGLQKAFDQLETQIADLTQIVTDIQTLQTAQALQLASITALQADMLDRIAEIEAAQAAADAAQSAANTVTRNDAITSSYVSPGIFLQGTDAGTDATITVANHTRHYGDATTTSVTTGSITGLAYNTVYYVYYDDPTRAGGAVTYNATTDARVALPNAAAGRHFAGSITTPASGGPLSAGGFNPPPSGGAVTGGAIP